MITAQSTAFADMRRALWSIPPRRIRRVMMVGYVHNAWRYAEHPAAFSLIRLECEIRLAIWLRAAGFTVLYKPHPDRREPIATLMRPHAAIVGGDFRDCTDVADVFLFSHFSTTAFPIALCTTKPVLCVLMNGEERRVDAEAFALLRKRCTFIPAALDDRQCIRYDEEVLRDALNCSSRVPDTAFVDRYLCPSAV